MTQLSHPMYESKPHFSLPSLVAIGCGIASFFAHPGTAMVLAIIAIIAGLIGVLMALSPNVRGGVISFFSIIVGVIALVLGTVRLVV